MRSHVTRAVRAAQRRNDRVSAYIRLAVVAVLVASLLLLKNEFPWSSLAVTILSVYGAIALLGLALAEVGMFRPWLPWVYATLDVSILFALLGALTELHGVPLSHAFRVPGAAMIFLFLAQSALRFQPALVIYTGFLYVALWAVLVVVFGGHGQGDGDDLPLHVEYVRLAITVLVTLILALLTARTRRLLRKSIVEARSKSNLAKYLPANLVQDMADNGIHLIDESHRQNVAVLFIDIRDFTAMSEKMDPGDVTALLTEFRQRMTRIIFAHGGTLDKFVGDAIMVEFGIPHAGEGDARDALMCAVDMLAGLRSWKTERRAEGLPPVDAGIGVHYGEAVVGALGDASRLEFTVIGDTVNTAARIERLTRQLDVPMVVSDALLRAAGGPPPHIICEALEPQNLRGRRALARVHAIRLAGDGAAREGDA